MPEPVRTAGLGLSLSRRPKLLFLAHRLPFPPDAGVSIRAYHILRLLARSFDISLVAFHRAGGTRSGEELDRHVAALRAMVGDVSVHPIPQEADRLRWVMDHARSVLRRQPYTEYLYRSEGFRRDLVQRLSTGRYDLVHMDSMDLVAYLPLLKGIPVVCAHHNVESELLRRRAAVERSRVKAAYLRHQADLLERVEREWCPKVALNVVVSELDRETMRRLAPDAAVTVVPNGVDDAAMRPEGPGDAGIVFVGGTTWFPNRDALEYFAKEILPRVRARRPGVPVVWVGRAGTAERDQYAQLGIELTGYVEDIRPYVGRAACFVVPLRVGGGTRLKILDAWAMGKAVVSTRVGAEGLRAVDGRNILLRDDPQAFAAAVIELLVDPGLRERLGRSARAEVERFYAWDSFGEPMVASYAGALRAWKGGSVRSPLVLAETGGR